MNDLAAWLNSLELGKYTQVFAENLARLWRDMGKHREAYDQLTSIYDWFTEGFDTADLKDAKALLDKEKFAVR